jgi:integrase
MPRLAKGPRLYLRTGRTDTKSGKPLPDVWVIRDGSVQRSTGCGPDRRGEAEQALASYIAEKWTPDAARAAYSRRDPAQVGVAEVLALYVQEKAPTLSSDAKTTAGFIKHLIAWWGDKAIAEVKRSTCQTYVAHRTTQPIRHGSTGRLVSAQTARRELEVLSAAIGYWHGEDALITRPKVWLPEKPESSRDALTRPQAACLLKASLGYRSNAQGRWTALPASSRANRAHLRRFILIGLYTGSRSNVITRLLWSESATHAYVDFEKGMIYRRGKGERDKATKRRPVVKLPPRLLAHMRRWRAADEKAGLTSVIHHGGAMIAGKVRTGFAGCVADAGLPAEITPHWLRHTCATWLMEAGVELWQAAAYTGMTTAVLEKHYGHHRPDYQAAASRALA